MEKQNHINDGESVHHDYGLSVCRFHIVLDTDGALSRTWVVLTSTESPRYSIENI